MSKVVSLFPDWHPRRRLPISNDKYEDAIYRANQTTIARAIFSEIFDDAIRQYQERIKKPARSMFDVDVRPKESKRTTEPESPDFLQ